MDLKSILSNSPLVLGLATILGLAAPQLGAPLAFLIVPALIVAMTFALQSITLNPKRLKNDIKPGLSALAINYGLLSGTIIALAFLLAPNQDIFAGLVIMAAIPAAIAVVPFTYLLKGDSSLSLVGEVIIYVGSLAIAPIIAIAFLGTSIAIDRLLESLVLLIIVPLILSQLIRKWRCCDEFSFTKPAVALSIGLVTYIIIALNQEAIFSQPALVLPLLLICFLRTFVIGVLVYFVLKKAKKAERVSYALFASFKNEGVTAAVAIALVSPLAALPAAFGSILELAFFVFLGRFLLNRASK